MTSNPNATSSPSTGWIVLKFGGTSVSTRECWDVIAETVRARRTEGLRPLIVCSALSGITDQLETLAERALRPDGAYEEPLKALRARHEELATSLEIDAEAVLGERLDALGQLAHGLSLTGQLSPALRARLVAFGEELSTALGSAFLTQQGLPTGLLDATDHLHARPAPGRSDTYRYLSADCEWTPDTALREALEIRDEEVFLTQGFMAGNEKGETVLLGRGGSDTSAAYFAAKLGAERLEIWTDVPGLFTGDPQTIPSARLLRQIGYWEAQELATMGGRVLHPRCLPPVREHAIPLHVRSTLAPDLEGTVISGATDGQQAQVKAVSSKPGVMLVSMRTVGMWQQVGFLADVFNVFKRHGLSVDLVATSEAEVTVSLDPTANTLQAGTLEALIDELSDYCEAEIIGPRAVVSLVGRRIRAILHRLGPALQVFDEQQVHLVSQAASDLNFSFVVEEEQAARTVRQLHAQLIDVQPAGRVFGPTWRALSQTTVPAPAEAQPWWHHRRQALLEIAELQAPVFVYDEATVRERARQVCSLGAADRLFYAMKANPNPHLLRVLAEEGFGFECVSPGEVRRVQDVLPSLDPDRVLFTPNFAPRDEYAFGFDEGLHVTLDNLYPLRAWPEVFEGRSLILRIDPGRGRGHHQHVRTAGAQSKFGIALGQTEAARQLTAEIGARVVGLHAHVGSGITRAETWAETAATLARLTETFPEASVLNVGGGLGVPAHAGPEALDVAALGEGLATFSRAHPDLSLWMEPGRFLVAEAGVLLARVTQRKRKAEGAEYVGVETGMNSLIRPALYGAYHEIVNLSKYGAPPTFTAEVVGPICESGDVLGRGRDLPPTEDGDVLLVAQTGAYGHAMASHYNLRPPAAEHVLPSTHAPAPGPTPEEH